MLCYICLFILSPPEYGCDKTWIIKLFKILFKVSFSATNNTTEFNYLNTQKTDCPSDHNVFFIFY